jgi:hypothetical protein
VRARAAESTVPCPPPTSSRSRISARGDAPLEAVREEWIGLSQPGADFRQRKQVDVPWDPGRFLASGNFTLSSCFPPDLGGGMRERLEGVERAQLRSGNTAGGEPQVPVAPTVQAAIRSDRVHEQPAAQFRLESSRGRSHPFHRSSRSVKLLISLERGIRLDRTRRTTRHPDPTPGLLVDCGRPRRPPRS